MFVSLDFNKSHFSDKKCKNLAKYVIITEYTIQPWLYFWCNNAYHWYKKKRVCVKIKDMVTLKSISSLDYENKIVGHNTGGFTLWLYTILTNRNEPLGRVYFKRKTYNVCVCEGIDSDLSYSKCHVAIYIYMYDALCACVIAERKGKSIS